MKPLSLKTAALALILALGTASGTADAWGGRGYWHRGPNGWVVGTALGLAAAGTYLALTTPRYVYPYPYYPGPVYAAPPVYGAPVYPAASVYATPPAPSAPSPDIIAYPSKGQSTQQQAYDRAACQQWAANQSGFDPAQASQWTTSAQTESYQRAMGACLMGRGYAIN
jgi:hypothetical protein